MEYFWLGLIQGLTEFLPVSSQGHLLVFEKLFQLEVNIALDTVLHLGTALAVIIYFWRDLVDLIFGSRKLLWPLLATTVVTGVLGICLKDYFEALFSAFQFVGPFFIVTGLVLLAGEWLSQKQNKAAEISWPAAVVIGLAQGLAIIPSLSRSAMTIAAALAVGLDRKLAARFSFLAAVPAILGAGLIQAKPIIETGTLGIGFAPLLIGFLAAFVSGLLAIKLFMRVMQKASLRGFAYYCLFVGLLVSWCLRG